ncbi:MAG: prolyl oligopeptidase family serine peptidase [Actinobacteria bacterium]|nr:prolyl oligopeptidase family serine peptidase [Actinomycetota bacterium]
MPVPVAAEALTADAVQVVELHADGEVLWWIELDPSLGRYSLIRDGVDLTPAGCSASSRVHEYGGAALRVHQDTAWFVDASTGAVVEVAGDGASRVLTEPDRRRFADLFVDLGRGRLLAVCEDHRAEPEPRTSLVTIDLASGAVADLVSGRDFYTNPRLSPDGTRLAYLAWDHPHMPWDTAQLVIADIDTDDHVHGEQVLAGGDDSSAGNPQWALDGTLFFTWDLHGWWHLWTLAPDGPRQVAPTDADHGSPGLNHPDYDVDDRAIVAVRHAHGRSTLVHIDRATGAVTERPAPGTHLRSPRILHTGVALLAGSATDLLGLWLLTPGAPARKVRGQTPASLDRRALTEPQSISVRTRDGAAITGDLYLPPGQGGGAQDPLPLLVHVHGGPVMANPPVLVLGMFSLAAPSYWTSRGYAYLDVNYRGTLRYGRASWQHLYGRWGQSDVDDAEDLTLELVRRGIVDAERIAIRGASAGGWAVCHAMTRPTCFRAGTALFPVSDLLSFQARTHKYESHYLENLIGPYDRAVYTARSPLAHASQVHGPMLFIQGDADKVCLPEQSIAMVDAVRAAGGHAQLVMVPDEGHGFVRAESNIRALHAEERFYHDLLRP